MPVSKYYKGSGEKVMKSMKKKYGSKKGESVFYATAKKHGMTGSGLFTKAEEKQGYKVMASASELHEDSEMMHHMKGDMMAMRRMPGKKHKMKMEMD